MTKLTTLKKGLLGTVALGLFSAGTAAAQTAAETAVDNTFTLNYEVNGAGQPEINNNAAPTRFLVDRLIDLTVESVGGSTIVVEGQQNAVTNFTLTNDGNGTQAYDLSVVNTVSGDNFDPATAAPVEIRYTLSDGTVVIFDAADTSTYPVLGPDESISIEVLQNIPAGQADGNTGDIILVADTLDSTTFVEETADTDGNDLLTSENVLADGTSTSEEAAEQGDDSATGTYIIAAAQVEGEKTVGIISQDGSNCTNLSAAVDTDAYSVPGACVEYRIRVTNNDTRETTSIDVSDTLPAELNFVTAAIATGGDFTGGTLNAPTVADTTVGLDCTGGACVVTFTGAGLPADDGVVPDNNNSPEGFIVIRALLK